MWLRPRSGAVTGAALLAACVLFAACSVSTPRDGFTEVGAGPTGVGSARGPQASVADGTAGTLPGGELPTGESGEATAAEPGATGDAGTAASPAGPGGAAEPAGTPATGVTSKTVTISAIAGFSGNYGAILTKIFENGFLVWADDVNANGGIHGRQVIVKKVDNKDTAEGGVAACKQIQNNQSYLAVSIVGFGGADVSSADCLNRAGIVTLAFNLSSYAPSWSTVYSAGDAGKQTRPMASFIKNVLGEKDKVAIMWTRDPLNGATRSALADELPKEGLNLVREEGVSTGQGSFVAELNRIRASGATSVALLVNTAEVVGILRDARAIGFTPKWTGNYWPTDENTSAGRTLFEGIKVLRNYASTNSPAFADYAAKAHKYGRDDIVNSTTMALYGMGLIAGEVLTNAGAQPTKESLAPGIEKLVDYNNQITMGLSFGPGVKVAEVAMWPIQCCNDDNTWKGIGPAKSRF